MNDFPTELFCPVMLRHYCLDRGIKISTYHYHQKHLPQASVIGPGDYPYLTRAELETHLAYWRNHVSKKTK